MEVDNLENIIKSVGNEIKKDIINLSKKTIKLADEYVYNTPVVKINLAIYAIPTALRIRKENPERMKLIKDYKGETKEDIFALTSAGLITQGAVYGISYLIGSSLIALPIISNFASYGYEKFKIVFDEINNQIEQNKAEIEKLKKIYNE